MPKKKNKKRRVKLFSVFVFLLILVGLFYGVKALLNTRIQNIYIYGNTFISDQEIIEQAGIEDYPSFYLTSSSEITTRLLNNPFFKDVKIQKSFWNVLSITVEESKPLFIKESNQRLVFDTKKEVNFDSLISVPVLINFVPDTVYDKFIVKMAELDTEVLSKISEIKYDPSEYDESRFLLYMVDGNYVYVNIARFSSLNYYNDIYVTLNGKKGTLYLDSGNHFVVFNNKKK